MIFRRVRRCAARATAISLAAASLAACSTSPRAKASDAGAGPSGGAFAVTADWLDHRLSVFDFDALVASPVARRGDAAVGPSRQDVLRGEVDLGSYAQGPLELKITPDGKTAMVSASPGFFTVPGASALVGAETIPTGPSKELFVDLDSRTVETALDVGDGPSGIAMTHDGSRAFIAHAGSTDVTVIDVKAREVLAQVDVGGLYAEEISIDDTDTVGIVTCLMANSLSKGARTFAVADMAGTLSAPIDLNSDAAGVPFFPGTKTAYVVLAYNPITSPASGYALIDASNPKSPVLLETATFSDATYVNFQAIAAPARGSILLPIATGGELSIREYALDDRDVTLKNTFDVGPTGLLGVFGIALDPAGHVVMTMPSDKKLAVFDLDSESAFTVPWTTEPGPMGIDRF